MTTASRFFDMTTAPVRIGMVRLAVRDPDAVAAFYQSVLGLERLAQTGGEITLGVAPTPLLELRGDPALRPQDPHQAGLFHTAFLLPTRADLARWLVHARQARVALQGASNHQVSEAIYLADPEGNGIEVYADRPLSHWHGPDGHIRMRTDPLDLADLLSAAEGTAWAGFPRKGCIGHVHLQVGDIGSADMFYHDILGLDIAARAPGASFYGSGGYHHQLAANVWNSRGAGPRSMGMAGLRAVQLRLRDPALREAIAARAAGAGIPAFSRPDGLTLHDPWGSAITLAVGGPGADT